MQMEVEDLSKYVINGGKPLVGDLNVQGAKNAALPIIAATVINGRENIISNIPRLKDVEIMKEIITSIGGTIIEEDDQIIINSKDINSIQIPDNLVREMRSSIIFMGALLTRFKEVKISYPGGCEIGPRPIDLHIKSLKQMGAKVTEAHGFIHCKTSGLVGADIHLDYPSVGATENTLLAAVLAKGTTIIRNAAREPEIVDLQSYLNKLGAKISGGGTSLITIEGVSGLSVCEHKVIPDRIVAGTYLVAGAITNGEIILKDIAVDHLQNIITKLRETACQIDVLNDKIRIRGNKHIRPIDLLKTAPFPGFPTDMQAQFMVLLAVAKGTSIINETVFESRFKHAEELIRMGANIKTIGQVAVISGVDKLTGAKVLAKDLRGGAALVLGGLVAEGTTEIQGLDHIDRGYDNFHTNLKNLGADIRRTEL